MSCRMPECHRIRLNGLAMKLDHDKDTSPGATFYYCSIHHVYHCVAVRAHRRLPQPLCGECAWLFFKFPKEAAKHPESDITATFGPSDMPDIATAATFSRRGVYDLLLDSQNNTTINNGSVAMPLDRNKRPLLTIEEILDHLNERARNCCNTSQSNNWKHFHADGDVIMQDVTSPSEQHSHLSTIPTGKIVHLPIRRSRDGSRSDFLQFIPYDNPAVFNVQPAQWHRVRRGVFLFRYTDYRGWPAWCCWAQGITYLEPEIRWVLTLIFDLIGFLIEKQWNAARNSITKGARDSVLKQLFWEGRSYLHSLMAIVKDMKEGFGVENLTVPQLLGIGLD
ncbi:hypothetical protein F5Y00DRAFT_268787 [Daldinia vernicosa]|uniref:uncharacterized protein n=1 Tax=Daldinia vernicosa TaxID=114800 RepID=UPI0020089425|nr:uncharacterized protein F5Y00DRAFT_268787 [Daldinia vernicosa]KAI0850021.1 hypothetical protein F5Y00DRAFT_268787 [Daldinia vernicosa]